MNIALHQKFFRQVCWFVLLSALISSPAFSAESEAVLVLDASGSMWGKVNGRHKIDIAREVVGKVLEMAPAERKLGLFAYGHNRKGDCKDIEQLAPVGASRQAIRSAIEKLNPKGKTPLSAAVLAAAESLRYTEEKATVVLVSDGVETCGIDPCMLGKQLEKDGVDFTAHVIGFDLTEKAATQLRCLADNTGGSFIAAADAAQLADALKVTVVEPEARPTRLVLKATELKNGPLADGQLQWVVRQSGVNGSVVFELEGAGQVSTELAPGTYDITADRMSDGAHGKALGVRVVSNNARQQVQVALQITFDATLATEPANEITAGKPLVVNWTGPDRRDDYIVVVRSQDKSIQGSNSTKTKAGNPLTVRAPLQPGDYEVRYVLRHPATDLVSLPIRVLPAQASLKAPASVGIGQNITVTWDGPDTKGDRIHLAKVQDKDTATTTLKFTHQGNPLVLKAPLQAGDYELRYLLGGRRVIKRVPIAVTQLSATITIADSVVAGSHFTVDWVGPDGAQDYLVIARAGDAPTRRARSVSVRRGNPSTMQAPLEPGAYELRYLLNNKKVLVTRALQVTHAEASIQGPAAAAAGSSIHVDWSGPDGKVDMISIAQPDDTPHRRVSQAYTRKGTPAILRAPVNPGDYELRYVQDSKKILARQTISIRPVQASVSAPASAMAGSAITVQWSGPDGQSDLITLARPDQADARRVVTRLTRDGNTLTLRAPVKPGEYELRYVQAGRKVIARQPIRIDPASATLNAPANAETGTAILVEWSGPANKNDWIVIARPEQAANRRLETALARDGSPTRVVTPLAPGQYEVRYILNGRKIIGSQPLTLSEAQATVVGPSPVRAGSRMSIEWTGPADARDWITVARAGEVPGEHSVIGLVRQGSPLVMAAPLKPGEYELRYVQRGKKVLATQPLTVHAATASLTVADSLQVGQSASIRWEGPADGGDLIVMVDPAQPDQRVSLVGLRADGGPAIMRMPLQPGQFELRYLHRGKVVLATRSVNLQPAEATVSGPRQVTADAPLSIQWTGPAFPGDLIAIARQADPPNKYWRVRSVRNTGPAQFTAPSVPGEYEIRYLLSGRRVLASHPLIVRAGQ